MTVYTVIRDKESWPYWWLKWLKLSVRAYATSSDARLWFFFSSRYFQAVLLAKHALDIKLLEIKLKNIRARGAGTPTCAARCATVSVLVDSRCSRTVGLSLDSLTISRKESIWGNRSSQH